MNTAHLNPLVVPGVAGMTFRTLQANCRYHDVVANLRVLETVFGLPAAVWSVDNRLGVTGTLRGFDDEITEAVWAWANGFETKPFIEPAYEDADASGRFVEPGFAVVHRLAGVTVGGRLVEPEEGR